MTLSKMLELLDLPCENADIVLWDDEAYDTEIVEAYCGLQNIHDLRERMRYSKYMKNEVCYVGYVDDATVRIEINKVVW